MLRISRVDREVGLDKTARWCGGQGPFPTDSGLRAGRGSEEGDRCDRDADLHLTHRWVDHATCLRSNRGSFRLANSLFACTEGGNVTRTLPLPQSIRTA